MLYAPKGWATLLVTHVISNTYRSLLLRVVLKRIMKNTFSAHQKSGDNLSFFYYLLLQHHVLSNLTNCIKDFQFNNGYVVHRLLRKCGYFQSHYTQC